MRLVSFQDQSLGERCVRSNMIGVLLYSHESEPITRAILAAPEMGFEIIALSLSDLLERVAIFDQIDSEGNASICWTLPCSKRIVNSNEFYLINRVLSMPEELFEGFEQEDRAYAKEEFRAYLAFAIESFPHCSSKPGPFGLCGNSFSLPQQWEQIKEATDQLLVPDYYLGNISLCPLGGTGVVYSMPYNYYYWRSDESLPIPADSSLAFVRPRGIPVIGCLVGTSFFKVFPYYSSDSLDAHQIQVLERIGPVLVKIFKYESAECLLFVEGNSITFGMISNVLYASKKKEWLAQAVIAALKNEILGYA